MLLVVTPRSGSNSVVTFHCWLLYVSDVVGAVLPPELLHAGLKSVCVFCPAASIASVTRPAPSYAVLAVVCHCSVPPV
jgi:hypothetical protein